jgi:hypothetical protein
LILNTENVHQQRWHCVASDPQELVDTVIEEIETIWYNALGGEIQEWRHDDVAGLRVWYACIIGHIMEGVECWVYVS